MKSTTEKQKILGTSARKRADVKRTKLISIRFNDEEIQKIEKMNEQRLTAGRFLRDLILKPNRIKNIPEKNLNNIQEIRRAGNLLNQLLKIIHTNKMCENKKEIEQAIETAITLQKILFNEIEEQRQ